MEHRVFGPGWPEAGRLEIDKIIEEQGAKVKNAFAQAREILSQKKIVSKEDLIEALRPVYAAIAEAKRRAQEAGLKERTGGEYIDTKILDLMELNTEAGIFQLTLQADNHPDRAPMYFLWPMRQTDGGTWANIADNEAASEFWNNIEAQTKQG